LTVDPEKLARLIADFNDVTGNNTSRFTCPITLRECDPDELVDGHILNASLTSANRRTVIQYGKVDNFFGTTVEPGFIRYWNLKYRAFEELIKENKNVRIYPADGSELEAFLATSKAARKARGKFPNITFRREGMPDIELFVKTTMDDARLRGEIELETTARFVPAHVVAAMLKAAHLAFFDLIGYRAICSPFGDTLRRTLKIYYEANARTDDAPKYFANFRNAVKFLMKGTTENASDALAVPALDTLNHRVFWIHRTPRGIVFAATCLFRINNIVVAVTVPQCDTNENVAVAIDFYERLLAERQPVQHTVHAAKIENGVCIVEQTPIPVLYGVPPQWQSRLSGSTF